MKLLDFICLGAQKSGTTSLHDILQQHPEICLPKIKETYFFSNDTLYNKGISWYKKAYFSHCNNNSIHGEIAPTYMYKKAVLKRISHTTEKIKVVLLLRNPVDRAYSHYKMNVRDGRESRDFLTALHQEYEHIKANKSYSRRLAYIHRSLYAYHLKQIKSFFSVEDMKFLIFEDLFKKSPEKDIIKDLQKFLGVTIKSLNQDVRSNPSHIGKNKLISLLYSYKNPLKKYRKKLIPSKKLRKTLTSILTKQPPALSKKTKKTLLNSYFIDDINKVESILGRDLSIWKKVG